MQKAAPAFPAAILVAITMFAVANTALVNYVTASRMLYGMSNQGLLPTVIGRVHRTRQTPHIAILILFALLAPLMLSAGITELASATVLLLLFAFAVVNASLFVLKRRPEEPKGRFEIPAFVPAIGFVLCLVLIAVRVFTGNFVAPLIASGLIAGILAIYFVTARNQTTTPPA
jgi:amino acid transporter